MIVIQINWKENEIQIKNKTIGSCYSEAFQELKKREVLSVGLAESITLAVQNLYLFLWTPILLSTAQSDINIGFIFFCMVTSIIIGTKMFEIGILYLQAGLYTMLSAVIFGLFACLLFIYFVENFIVRLILFAILNGLCGLYQPLFSFIKYRILEEKHRALLMNIFRIPLNLYVIVCLLMLKIMDPFHVCLIASALALVAFFIVLSMIIVRPPIPRDGKSAFIIARKPTMRPSIN